MLLVFMAVLRGKGIDTDRGKQLLDVHLSRGTLALPIETVTPHDLATGATPDSVMHIPRQSVL